MRLVPEHPGRLLAHPLRHRLLFEYATEPASPAQVARRVGERLNTVSYHTRVLADRGLLTLVRTEQRRGGTAHYYHTTTGTLIEDVDWEALPLVLRRALVRGLLITIENESTAAALEGGFDPAHAHVTRWPGALDTHAAAQVARLLQSLLDDLARIQADADARGGPFTRLEVVMMGFRAAKERGASSTP
jgi:DNA-binding transcriptional ArsR family regulator